MLSTYERTLRTFPALFLLMAAAILLRIWNLGQQSFWIDEIFSVILARIDTLALVQNLNIDVHPPLYFLVLKTWMSLGLEGEAGLRLLSVLFGSASCFLIYKFARLLFNESTAMTAFVILVFSAYHIRYSQELRSYEMMTCLSLLSFYFFEKLHHNFKKADFLIYILSSVLLLYTHTFSVLVIASQIIFYLISFLFFRYQWPRIPFKKWVGTQIILGLFYLPWILNLWTQSLQVSPEGWLGLAKPSLTAPLAVMRYFLGSMPLFILFAFLVAYRGMIILKNMRKISWNFSVRTHRSQVLLATWLMIGMGVPFIISYFWTPVFMARLMTASSIPLFILIAYLFTSLPFRKLKNGLACFFIFFTFLAIFHYYATPKKEAWREAAAFIDRHAETQDLIVFHAGFAQLGYQLYSTRSDLLILGIPAIRDENFVRKGISESLLNEIFRGNVYIWKIIADQSAILKENEVSKLSPLLAEHSRIWLVFSYDKDPRQWILRTLNKSHEKISIQKFRGIDVLRFQRK